MRNLCEISDDCNVQYTSFLGDGFCDGFTYDTEACCRDGGDCNLPVFGDCKVSNTCQVLPSEISMLGDGICDDSYRFNTNTEACCWDGFDCGPPEQEQEQEQFFGECKVSAECSVTTSYWSRLGDGYCDDYFPYNSKACCWDGGDCSRELNEGSIAAIAIAVVIFVCCFSAALHCAKRSSSSTNNGTPTAQPAATTITAPPLTEEERISERRELILMSIIHKVNHKYLEKLIVITKTCIRCMILIK